MYPIGHLFLILYLLSGCLGSDPEQISILSFGGNGNIGSEVIEQIFDSGIPLTLTLVTRGNWHFDSEVRIKPKVDHFIVCDRDNGLESCPKLMQRIRETKKFDLVLDFSGYKSEWIGDAVKALKDKVGLYMYISSDSVYEVSEAKDEVRRSKESDAKRPKDPKRREELSLYDE